MLLPQINSSFELEQKSNFDFKIAHDGEPIPGLSKLFPWLMTSVVKTLPLVSSLNLSSFNFQPWALVTYAGKSQKDFVVIRCRQLYVQEVPSVLI